jgi:hypothetical protein
VNEFPIIIKSKSDRHQLLIGHLVNEFPIVISFGLVNIFWNVINEVLSEGL